MLETGTLIRTFHRLVRTAMHAQGVPSSGDTESYLVRLLLAFVRPPKADLLDPPLGPALIAALQLPPAQRADELRRLGDTTLFLTGLFVERLERTLVGPHYYVAIGRTAYSRLSMECADAAPAPPYAELAHRFPDFVRVLAEIADRDLFARDEDVVRVYKRWLLTRADRDAAALVRRGVIPWAPASDVRH